MRRLPAVLVACALLALGACSGAGAPEGQNASDIGFVEGAGTVRTVPVGERGEAPNLVGDKLGGGTLDLADYRGQVVVVNVWASWCAPCRKETPGLIASSKELAKSGVSFVGINTGNDNTASATAYVRAAGIPYPSFFDPDGKVMLELRDAKVPPKAIPSTLVLAPDGRVAATVIGGVTQQTLSKLVGKVILESARASASASASVSPPAAPSTEAAP